MNQQERVNEQLACVMLNEMYQFVGLLDPEGRLLEVNQTALDAIGRERSSVLGLPFWETPWWNVNEETIELLKESIRRAAAGEFFRAEVKNYGADAGKEIVELDYSLKPVRNEQGDVVYLVPEGRNITEKKAAEAEVQRKNEELRKLYEKLRDMEALRSNFFANVSHELRTPLALILGPVRQLREEGSLSGKAAHALSVIESNAMVLVKHVNDLLDVAKLDAKKLSLSSTTFNLTTLIRRIASMFEILATETEISLKLELLDDLWIHGDAEKVERILLNLISNAFKFTPRGGTVSIRATASERGIRTSVADSGMGIPASRREAIFERFRQDSQGDQRLFGGTGLGLSIAKEFADLHGGTIEVDESPIGGALFTFSLPISLRRDTASPLDQPTKSEFARASLQQLKTELQTKSRLTQAHGPFGRLGGPTVLVVEDNDEMGRFIAESLADEYCVLRAYDGIEAFAIAKDNLPDLILTDIMMPRRGGEELLLDLRADASLAEIPVIALTAKAEEDLRIRLLKNGAKDFLSKPFSVAELKARVGIHVEMKLTRDALVKSNESSGDKLSIVAKELRARTDELESTTGRLRKVDRVKDEFLMTLSHELRTPLTSILGWAQILKSGPVQPAILAQASDTIDRNVKSQLALIADLLDTSAVITGKLRVDLKPMDLRDVVAAALNTLRPAMTAQSLTINVALGDAPALVLGDSERLQQVAWNLLSNATKFTPRGGTITVSILKIGNETELTVEDNGAGIEPDVLPRVFDRFWQAESSATRQKGGLGLGLALVRHLSELHGGRVFAASQGKDRGARFTVLMPTLEPGLARQGASATPSPGKPIDARSLTLAGTKVLIVEDDRDTRDLIALALTTAGAKVDIAATPAEALKNCVVRPPDLVISDLGLPGEDGVSLLARIRETKENRGVPAIALSAYASEADQARALGAGFQRYLSKPTSLSELIQIAAQTATPRSADHLLST